MEDFWNSAMSFVISGTLTRYSIYETIALYFCTLKALEHGLVLHTIGIELGRFVALTQAQ